MTAEAVSSQSPAQIPAPVQRDFYYWTRSFVAGGKANFRSLLNPLVESKKYICSATHTYDVVYNVLLELN